MHGKKGNQTRSEHEKYEGAARIAPKTRQNKQRKTYVEPICRGLKFRFSATAH
jgi:hypothetical protein